MRSGLFVCFVLVGGCQPAIVLGYHPNLVEQESLPYGLPECPGTLLNRQYFVICHDDDWLIARWVGHYVTPDALVEQWSRHQRFFHRDRELPPAQRVENRDYEGSGYDRGHMAPAGDFKHSLPALRATFVISNMAPQTAALNRGLWRKLEHSLRKALPRAKGMLIYTGNLFLDESGGPVAPSRRIGLHRVAVPTHCFKIALFDQVDGTVTVFAFIMANTHEPEDRPLTAFQVSVDEIERLTGLDFFPEQLGWAALEAEVRPWADSR